MLSSSSQYFRGYLDASLQPGIPHPSFLPDNTTTTRGAGARSKNKGGPPKSPPRWQRPKPNPLFIPPHPHLHPRRTRPRPFLPGAEGAPGLALVRRRAVPFPPRPRRPGNPTTKQLCCGEEASGDPGAPVEAGAVPQGTGGSILLSISTPLLLRCLPGFLLSCCQLGSADLSELLPARTNRKA